MIVKVYRSGFWYESANENSARALSRHCGATPTRSRKDGRLIAGLSYHQLDEARCILAKLGHVLEVTEEQTP